MKKNARMQIEEAIAEKTVRALIAASFDIVVNDGEENITDYHSDPDYIIDAMFGEKTATDENVLFVRRESDEVTGWVKFVYGNDGWDVISDYTVNLEEILKPINEIAQDENLKTLFKVS